MVMKYALYGAVMLLACQLPLLPAAAQTEAAPQLGGPLIPGLCLMSREAVIANAAVGKAADARLKELGAAAQAEIDRQRQPLEAEAAALEGQPDTAELQQRRAAFATNWQALQRLADQNNRQIDATRNKVLGQIADEAQSVIAQVYGQKSCGLLLDRSSALGGNFGNDLTVDVVRALDAKIQTIQFELEPLPAQAGA